MTASLRRAAGTWEGEGGRGRVSSPHSKSRARGRQTHNLHHFSGRFEFDDLEGLKSGDSSNKGPLNFTRAGGFHPWKASSLPINFFCVCHSVSSSSAGLIRCNRGWPRCHATEVCCSTSTTKSPCRRMISLQQR